MHFACDSVHSQLSLLLLRECAVFTLPLNVQPGLMDLVRICKTGNEHIATVLHCSVTGLLLFYKIQEVI